MKFLIDAQLPARLAEFLNRVGHDSLHKRANRSTDQPIARSRSAQMKMAAWLSRRIGASEKLSTTT